MEQRKKRPLVKFRKAFIAYLVILFFSLIFTQALRSTASNLLFWFIVLVPVISLIYVLIGKALLQVYVDSDINKAEKLQPVEYEIRIINSSPFAYPFMEAVFSVPDENGVRCHEQSTMFSLAPFDDCLVKRPAVFRYRGVYEIGVRCLYISDFLGLYSVRLDIEIYNNVLVYPRKPEMNMAMKNSATDIPNDSYLTVFSAEKSEVSNIREYVMGDTLKSIHWKLSSKAWDGGLMVKDFNTNTSRSVYMLCDFSRSIPPEAFSDSGMGAKRDKNENGFAAGEKKKSVKLKKEKSLEKSLEKSEKKAKKAKKTDSDEINGIDNASATERKKSDKAAKALKKRNDLKNKLEKKKRAILGAEGGRSEGIFDDGISPDQRRRASIAIGGTIKPDYLSDMDEYCADGVLEMAVGAVVNELRSGNQVNLIWHDSRQENGIAAVQLTCPEDFEVVFPVFATAPIADESENVTDLLPLITESLNVTIRICTSNLDPLSVNLYASVPSLFGGAGTGCATEVLLYNPEDRYEDVSARREYVEISRSRLAHEGVKLTELKIEHDDFGVTNVIENAY